MKRMIVVTGVLAAALLAASAPLAAQQRSIVSGPELEAAVVERGAGQLGDQATVARFLERRDVREAAGRLGLTGDELAARAGALSAPALAEVAQQVRGAEAQLAGGDTLVISSTIVIIALLVLILILVAD